MDIPPSGQSLRQRTGEKAAEHTGGARNPSDNLATDTSLANDAWRKPQTRGRHGPARGWQANLFDRQSDTGFLTDKDREDSDDGRRTVTAGSHGMATGTRPSTDTYPIIVQYMLDIGEGEQETFIFAVFFSPTPRHSELPRHALTSGKKHTQKMTRQN
jgi:hypothetical protein